MKIHCHIIRDLIPLVQDGVASTESRRLVFQHIEACPVCHEEFQNMSGMLGEDVPDLHDEKIIRSMKRHIYYMQLFILVAGAALGAGLTNSLGMFYNFIIMPALGALAYLTFNNRWFRLLPVIFVLVYLLQMIHAMLTKGFYWQIFIAASVYGLIYSALAFVGVVIAWLLKFAFRKDGKFNE